MQFTEPVVLNSIDVVSSGGSHAVINSLGQPFILHQEIEFGFIIIDVLAPPTTLKLEIDFLFRCKLLRFFFLMIGSFG